MKSSSKFLLSQSKTNDYDLCRPGYKRRIPGQGMPLMSNPEKYGDLIIEFDVEYPNSLNSDQKLYIKEALINNPPTKKPHHHQQKKKPAANNDDEDD